MAELINMERIDFINKLKAGDKTDCPCCGRHAQMYRRSLHHTAAKKLVQLYRLGGDSQYVHTSQLVDTGETSIGDFSKAKYWRLIAEAQVTDERKKTSGLWKLTEKGIAFVKCQVTIPRTVLVFDDRTYGFSEDHVTIEQCLSGGGFNYRDLMDA